MATFTDRRIDSRAVLAVGATNLQEAMVAELYGKIYLYSLGRLTGDPGKGYMEKLNSAMTELIGAEKLAAIQKAVI